MDENKIGIIIGSIFLIVMIVLFLFVIIVKQEKTYSTDYDCSQLRDCVLADINCLDRHITNDFLGLKWDSKDKAFLMHQKEYYKNKCMPTSKGVGK